jgi:hypothetical protein
MTGGDQQRRWPGLGWLWLAGTLAGAAAFCVYSRTWRDAWHVLYDVPAALASYSFPAMLLAEAAAVRPGAAWYVRLAALAAMAVATVGREFLVWPVSGHVTCVASVAIIQSADGRLPPLLRLAYWTAVPIVVLMRIFYLDGGLSMPLAAGASAGAVIGVAAVCLIARAKA